LIQLLCFLLLLFLAFFCRIAGILREQPLSGSQRCTRCCYSPQSSAVFSAAAVSSTFLLHCRHPA
jgi:hypothetical protein